MGLHGDFNRPDAIGLPCRIGAVIQHILTEWTAATTASTRRPCRTRWPGSARGQMQKFAAGKFHFEPPSPFTRDSPDECQPGIKCSRFPGPLARQTRGADRYQHLGNPNAWSRAPRDEPQNLLEHLPCYGDLGHLEDKIEAVAHHLRADLDQLVLQGRLWRPQRPQEIGEVVGERMKLEPYDVGGERLARQPRPFDPALAFLDPLLARAALL